MSLSINSLTNPLSLDSLEFRRRFHLTPGLTHSSLALQAKLIAEEANEVEDAVDSLSLDLEDRKAKVHLLKELADLTYVCFQMAAAFGWDLTEACGRVHRSNLSKLGPDGEPIRRDDGKVLKGSNYFEPDLGDLV